MLPPLDRVWQRSHYDRSVTFVTAAPDSFTRNSPAPLSNDFRAGWGGFHPHPAQKWRSGRVRGATLGCRNTPKWPLLTQLELQALDLEELFQAELAEFPAVARLLVAAERCRRVERATVDL